MEQKHWLKSYPEGVPSEVHPQQYSSLTQLLEESFKSYSLSLPQVALLAEMDPTNLHKSDLVNVNMKLGEVAAETNRIESARRQRSADSQS